MQTKKIVGTASFKPNAASWRARLAVGGGLSLIPISLDFHCLSFKLTFMQKLFSKISSGVVSSLVIVAIVATLSPVALMMAILPDAKPPSPQDVIVQIVAPEPAVHINCLVPKPSREPVFSFLNKHSAGLFSFIDCFTLSDKAQTCAEGHDYFYYNDVRFNIPTITYRQPSSEHSSEG